MGQMLMIAIVVLAFSGIALTVVSEGGILDPPHIPHTNLQENINPGDDTIQILHIGGEAIDLSAINIILSANGKQTEFNSSEFKVKNPDGSNSTDDALMIGDCIVIDTTGKEVNLMSGDTVDMSIVHTPSEQVIQRTVFQTGSEKLPGWITSYPYGTVFSKSGSCAEESLPMELVGWIDDGLETECAMEKNKISYETFTFGIDKYEVNIKEPLKNVLLEFIYSCHDNSQKDMKLEINVGGSEWIKVADLKGPNKNGNSQEIFTITDKVNTVEKLNNLTVRLSATGNANSKNKEGWVDFVGIRVES
jgi:FlaG/FlaF family flagellin (archaellin)